MASENNVSTEKPGPDSRAASISAGSIAASKPAPCRGPPRPVRSTSACVSSGSRRHTARGGASLRGILTRSFTEPKADLAAAVAPFLDEEADKPAAGSPSRSPFGRWRLSNPVTRAGLHRGYDSGAQLDFESISNSMMARISMGRHRSSQSFEGLPPSSPRRAIQSLDLMPPAAASTSAATYLSGTKLPKPSEVPSRYRTYDSRAQFGNNREPFMMVKRHLGW